MRLTKREGKHTVRIGNEWRRHDPIWDRLAELEDAEEERNSVGVQMSKWDFVIDAYGELKEYICECGYGSSSASKYCPSCGVKMDNSDYEIRLKKALLHST